MQEMQLSRKHEMNESLQLLGTGELLVLIYRLKIIQQIFLCNEIYKRSDLYDL